jgi:hypothetical protein
MPSFSIWGNDLISALKSNQVLTPKEEPVSECFQVRDGWFCAPIPVSLGVFNPCGIDWRMLAVAYGLLVGNSGQASTKVRVMVAFG